MGGSSPRMWGKGEPVDRMVRQYRIIPTDVGKSLPKPQGNPFKSDHPHGCGEKLRTPDITACLGGSSPRMWGKVILCNQSRFILWIIPTDVGKRNREYVFRSIPPDHPHGCGEKRLCSSTVLRYSGSSPRMWGKGSPPPGDPPERRIIPTDVGKSQPNQICLVAYPDHPHGCGEKRLCSSAH